MKMKEYYSSTFLKHFYPFWRKINFPGKHRKMLSDAIAALELQRSSNILELACGPGDGIPLLQEKIDATGLLLCTDFSSEMLKLAKKQAQKFQDKRIRVEKLDASQIQFREEFDAIVCMLGFSVIPNYEKAIIGANNFLKSNGRIAVIDAQCYKKFPFYLLNPFVRIVHRFVFKAKERDIRSQLNRSFKEVLYREYSGGSYFLYIGKKYAQR